MGWFWTGLIVTLAAAALFFVRQRRSAAEAQHIIAVIPRLDRNGAEALYRQALAAIFRHIQPVLIRRGTGSDLDHQLDIAARCKDRINELDGLPHGPDHLGALRQQILDGLKPATQATI